MNQKSAIEAEQAALWNGSAGEAWVEAQALLDGMFQPFEDHLVKAAAARSRSRVLDIGCGAGSTTLALARLLGEQGTAVGVDVSAPLLAAARARAERERSRAAFVVADAGAHAFESKSFDLLISRFGVMFFGDPVDAFENLRRATTDAGELRFVAWRGPAENPFMTTAERAAASLLPEIPARIPDAPGQFGFADRDRVHRILSASGWSEIDIQPLDEVCSLPEPGLMKYLTRLGPLGRVLQEADAALRDRVVDSVRAAFQPYVHGAEVRFGAACWSVSARAPARG